MEFWILLKYRRVFKDIQESLKTLGGVNKKTKTSNILQTIPAWAPARMEFLILLKYRRVFKEIQESLKTLGFKKTKKSKILQTIPAWVFTRGILGPTSGSSLGL